MSNDFAIEQFSCVEQKLEEYETFKVGERVWFNVSLIHEKYSCGVIKKILIQTNNTVCFSIWDETKQMQRNFYSKSLFHEKPIKKRKPRRKKE